MESPQHQTHETEPDTAEDRINTAKGQKVLGSRVMMSVQRPDGTVYEYYLPTRPLGVVFTTEGPIELSHDGEDH